MPSDTEIYGARSGIQKAVRRGDLQLVKTCFDLLWPDGKHRQWLKWRTPTFVVEDVWTMAGELFKHQAAVQELHGQEEMDAWFRFLMKLSSAVKNQDGGWLWYLAVHGRKRLEHPEWLLMRAMAKAAKEAGGPDKLPLDEAKRVFLDREFTPYEEGAIEAIERRRRAGGMESDRWMCLACMMLVARRGLDESEVSSMLQSQKGKYAGMKLSAKPQELPWYVHDWHTRAGQRAANVWNKNHNKFGIPKEVLPAIWFHYVSAVLGEKVLPNRVEWSDCMTPTWLDQIWWLENKRAAVEKTNRTLSEMDEIWQQIEPKARELVAWSLTKD